MEAKDGRFKILITHSETQLIKFLLGKISYCKAKNCWKKSRTVRLNCKTCTVRLKTVGKFSYCRLQTVKSRTVRLKTVKSRTVRLRTVKSPTVRLKTVKSRTISLNIVGKFSYCKATICQISYCKPKNCWKNLVL